MKAAPVLGPISKDEQGHFPGALESRWHSEPGRSLLMDGAGRERAGAPFRSCTSGGLALLRPLRFRPVSPSSAAPPEATSRTARELVDPGKWRAERNLFRSPVQGRASFF